RGFTCIGHANQPNVGKEPEFERHPALITGLALLCHARSLVCGRLEAGVPPPTATAPRNNEALAHLRQVGEKITAVGITHDGTGRHLDFQIISRRPEPVEVSAGLPVPCTKVDLSLE